MRDEPEREPVVSFGLSCPREERKHMVTAFSLYEEQLVLIDSAVARLQALGARKMSRSRLVRVAIDRLDLDQLVKEVSTVMWAKL